MLIELLKPVKSTIQIKPVSIDNNVFKLHYKATMVILLSASLMVTATQLFGKPIECIPSKAVDTDLLQTFCWIQSTFTLPDALTKKVGVEVPAPGIDKYSEGENRTYHKYYQWVWIVLLLQAIAFYMPRFLWKVWEGERLKSLVIRLNIPVLKEEDRKEQILLLVNYLKDNFTHHNLYFCYYIICECLNFTNVLVQIFIVDKFLGGVFANYGLDVMSYSESENQENRTDPMIVAFPRMTKCTFWHYGPSGDVQRHDHFCLLPLNIINEKIYIIIWFWFMFLTIVSGLLIIYRMIILFFPQVRNYILKKRAGVTPKYNIDLVMENAKVGDWWILYLLSKNIDAYNFRDVLHGFVREIQEGGTDLVEEKNPSSFRELNDDNRRDDSDDDDESRV